MKNIYKIALTILLALPLVTFAVPVSVDRLNGNHIEPLIKTDYIKASYLVASSTTATSTFANGIDLSGGCFAIAGTCLGGGSSQWTTSGSDIYYNTGDVGIGTTTPVSQLTVQKTIVSDVDYPAIALSRNDTANALGDSLGDIDFWSNDASTDGPGIGSRIRGVVDDVAGRSYGLSLWTRSGGAGTPISEKMRIASDGKVGIGTTTPAARLDVAGTIAQDSPIARFSFGGTWNDEMRIVPGGANGTNPSLRLYRTTGVGLNYNPYEMKLVAGGSLQFNTGSSAAKGSESYTTNTMTLSAAGNVGIASSSPTYPLTVTGNMWLQGKYAKFGDSTSEYTCINLADACVELSGDGNTAGGVFYQVGNRNAGTSAYSGLTILNDLGNLGNNATYYAGLFLNSSVYSDPTFGTANNVPNILQLGNTMGSISIQASSTLPSVPSFIQFLAGGVNTTNEIARITTAGLGVGSSTPYAKLSVTNTGTAPTALFEDSASPDTTPFVIDNAGNVGIGTTTASRILDVWGSASISSLATNSSIQFGNLSAGSGVGFIQATNNANNSARPLILQPSGGNVGIGTTTPRNKLEIVGTAVTGGSQCDTTNDLFCLQNTLGTSINVITPSTVTGGLIFSDTTRAVGRLTYDHVTNDLFFHTNSTEKMRITSAGKVGIGTTTPNTTLNLYGGGLGVNPGATGKPTCAVDRRGTYWHTFGGAGVKDNVEVCAKDAGDAYAWRTLY